MMIQTCTYLGLDPGSSSGAICRMTCTRTLLTKTPVLRWRTKVDVLDVFSLDKLGASETAYLLLDIRDVCDDGFLYAVLEQVNAMPKQGVSSSFKFGQNYGELHGILLALNIPFVRMRPAIWKDLVELPRPEKRYESGLKKGKRDSNQAKALEQIHVKTLLSHDVSRKQAAAVLLAHAARLLVDKGKSDQFFKRGST